MKFRSLSFLIIFICVNQAQSESILFEPVSKPLRTGKVLNYCLVAGLPLGLASGIFAHDYTNGSIGITIPIGLAATMIGCYIGYPQNKVLKNSVEKFLFPTAYAT